MKRSRIDKGIQHEIMPSYIGMEMKHVRRHGWDFARFSYFFDQYN